MTNEPIHRLGHHRRFAAPATAPLIGIGAEVDIGIRNSSSRYLGATTSRIRRTPTLLITERPGIVQVVRTAVTLDVSAWRDFFDFRTTVDASSARSPHPYSSVARVANAVGGDRADSRRRHRSHRHASGVADVAVSVVSAAPLVLLSIPTGFSWVSLREPGFSIARELSNDSISFEVVPLARWTVRRLSRQHTTTSKRGR